MSPSSNSASVSTTPDASREPDLDEEDRSRLLITKLKSLKEALHTCNKTHSCKEQDGLTLPTRLLHIGRNKDDKVRVIDSSDIKPTRSSPTTYAALSYCWGSYPALKSTRSNLASHKRGFPISNLPLTLRDAVSVTRDLGLLYLWIDALCILQDCKEDWQRESERMGEVYGHAFVTIFAFGAQDCDGGLYPRAGLSPRTKSMSARSRFKEEPLNHRAWALQEWLLSPRRLMFLSYDAIFHCLQGKALSTELGFGVGVYDYRLPQVPIVRPRDWEVLVMNYSSRDLTNPSDKFPAIEGLMQRFDKLTNGQSGRYLAGLWEAHLPRSLLWHRIRNSLSVHDANRAGPTTRIAPSWSWASINGSVDFGNHEILGEPEDSEDVISVDIGPPAENHPFQSTTYRLGIRSRMKSLHMDSFREPNYGDSPSNTPLLLLKARGAAFGEDPEVKLWGDYHLRPFIEGSRTLKFCAVTTHTAVDFRRWPPPMSFHRKKEVWGLLLVQIDQARFERIGCGTCRLSWLEDAVEAIGEIT